MANEESLTNQLRMVLDPTHKDFKGMPPDAATTQKNWTTALKTGVLDFMTPSNATGLGSLGYTEELKKIDDALPVTVFGPTPGLQAALSKALNDFRDEVKIQTELMSNPAIKLLWHSIIVIKPQPDINIEIDVPMPTSPPYFTKEQGYETQKEFAEVLASTIESWLTTGIFTPYWPPGSLIPPIPTPSTGVPWGAEGDQPPKDTDEDGTPDDEDTEPENPDVQ